MKKILLITLIFSTTMAISTCSNREKNGEYDSLQVSNPDEMNSEEKAQKKKAEETPEKMICNKFL